VKLPLHVLSELAKYYNKAISSEKSQREESSVYRFSLGMFALMISYFYSCTRGERQKR
jgi:hypothetical protein